MHLAVKTGRLQRYAGFMLAIINNISALRFWCMTETAVHEVSAPFALGNDTHPATSYPATSHPSVSFPPSSYPETPHPASDDQDRPCYDFSNGPLHLLVEPDSHRKPSRQFIRHTLSRSYPTGAFRRLDSRTAIVSPELCFVEMGTVLPFCKLVELGNFLCGTYTMNPNAPDLNTKPPLTTKASLTRFVSQCEQLHGIAAAKRALAYLCEGAASPRENKIATLLVLPSQQGGYGFPLPQMNHRFIFPKTAARLFGHDHVVIDLYWPECKLAIEYDGFDYHSSERALTRDRRKSSELNHYGITVIRVDKTQVCSPQAFFVLAKKLFHQMGKRLRKPSPATLRARRETFYRLMK